MSKDGAAADFAKGSNAQPPTPPRNNPNLEQISARHAG
jgi:hypothetical protein